MRKSLEIRSASAVVACLVSVVLSGCAPSPSPADKLALAAQKISEIRDMREDPRFNRPEPLSNHFALPTSWDERCNAPERLVGHYLALVPDKKSPTGHRAVILGHVLNAQGNRSVALRKATMTRYEGRVDGSFAPTLTFVPGRLDVRNDHLYDLKVAEDRVFQVASQAEFLDRKKVEKVWAKLPKKYRDVFFVSAAAATTITAQAYAPGGMTQEGAFAAKMGEILYREGEAPLVRPGLYITLLSEGGLFGDFDPRDGFYRKKGSAEKVNLKKRGKGGNLASFQTIQLLRKTLASSGLQVAN